MSEHRRRRWASYLLPASVALAACLAIRRSLAPSHVEQHEPASTPGIASTPRPKLAAALSSSRVASRSLPTLDGGASGPFVDALEGVWRDALLHGTDGDRAGELNDRILRILEREKIGNAVSRERWAGQGVQAMMMDLMSVPVVTSPGSAVLLRQDAERARANAASFAAYVLRPPSSAIHPGINRAPPPTNIPAGYVPVRWDTLGGFLYREGMVLPASVTSLEGARVALTGYMDMLDETEAIHEFVLIEAVYSCCYGTPPDINQIVLVHVDGKKGISPADGPIMVFGTLDVGEQREDGAVSSVYRLELKGLRRME